MLCICKLFITVNFGFFIELNQSPSAILSLSNRSLKTEAYKLWSMCHSHPVPCFCTSHELRMTFTFINSWGKKSKEEEF